MLGTAHALSSIATAKGNAKIFDNQEDLIPTCQNHVGRLLLGRM